jgi:hypothetical protein
MAKRTFSWFQDAATRHDNSQKVASRRSLLFHGAKTPKRLNAMTLADGASVVKGKAGFFVMRQSRVGKGGHCEDGALRTSRSQTGNPHP